MSQIWWDRVPNALALVNDTVDSLTEEKSIILQHAVPLPWRDEFIDSVKWRVMQQNSSKSFERIRDPGDPGQFLLSRFCKPEKKAQYRPSRPLAAFLAESDDIVLHERYIWVNLSSLEDLNAWAGFVSDYVQFRPKGRELATFVLEWPGAARLPRRKGINSIIFEEYIGEYDRTVFAMLASSAIAGSSFQKNYLAELAVNVIGNDIELYSECFRRFGEFLKDPYRVIQECVAEEIRSDDTDFEFTKSESDVHHAIWLTQIRTVYPILEEYRENFIQRHRADIASQLPITSSNGVVYNDPDDVELGILVFIAANGGMLLSQGEYDTLVRYKDARNQLSHLGILTYEEISSLRF